MRTLTPADSEPEFALELSDIDFNADADDDKDPYVSPILVPPRYSVLPSANSPPASTSNVSLSTTTNATNPVPHSGIFKGYEVNQRFFGDMWALTEPVDPSLIAYRSIHIPLLSADHIEYYFNQLKNGFGIPHEIFIRIIDKCNCGNYFRKDHLNQEHGPTCHEWLRMLPPVESRPFNASALDALAAPIHKHPIPLAAATALSCLPCHNPLPPLLQPLAV
ncbi:hypothetical protein M422DRAFT_266512 [Sphaerobolus stellatus SS14]|uniref:Uncharacterized protein n=1 Tax=Sphaerobolus stellatus (strain SS14) TaxID=990650 RepID=A0A0C9V2J6_SPHS4|nr:hypothetical protein M422DRAFT_266512 [Sphaerobolus stellatus SS14]